MSNKNLELALYLFHQGTNFRSQELLGSHTIKRGRGTAVVFRVWAPNAKEVSIVGEFNDWDAEKNPMELITEQGIWQGYSKKLPVGTLYKYCITTQSGEKLYKADPYAFFAENPPNTASRYFPDDEYIWKDKEYLKKRKHKFLRNIPMNIYEVHLGSWLHNEDGEPLTYIEMADKLCEYTCEMGYTHIELLPLTEFPYNGSWGYQTTGYFAPTSRYGNPTDFKYLIDKLHEKNISVILDWTGAHFPKDAHGLAEFDGTAVYEHQNPRRGEQPQWGTKVFDFGKNEVQSFLISSALYWIENFHLDGLRVDAVSSMLYLDYGREHGQWEQNENGSNENLEAISLLKAMNSHILTEHKDVLMIAEESTAWPLVTRPPHMGGLGFSYKWNMGWMNDMLSYAELDPIYREYNHDKVTFGMFYAFSEDFILPISHDEVVHGKGSLLNRMPGEYEEKFAGDRAFFGFMMAHPGKKLNFMGNEIGQFIEWNYEQQLDWLLLEYEPHKQLQDYIKTLNHLYKDTPALYEIDDGWDGFKWIVPDDSQQNIVVFARYADDGEFVIVMVNFSPVLREEYSFGVPKEGTYEEILSSDDVKFGGSGLHSKKVESESLPMHGFPNSITITAPPLSAVYFKLSDI